MPVDQANDVQVRVRRPRNDDITRLEVGTRMTDAETTEGRVPRDERQRDDEIAVQVVDVVPRQLLLVLVIFLPCALEQRSTELL